MPTYEYRCAEGHHFEAFQRMSDDPIDTCPECGADAERLLSAGAGLVFKGSGFYITDSRSESYRKDAAGESVSKPDGKSKPEAGSDASSSSKSASSSDSSASSSSSTD